MQHSQTPRKSLHNMDTHVPSAAQKARAHLLEAPLGLWLHNDEGVGWPQAHATQQQTLEEVEGLQHTAKQRALSAAQACTTAMLHPIAWK